MSDESKTLDPAPSATASFLIVGTYTEKLGHVDGKGKGIHLFHVADAAKGVLKPTGPGFVDVGGPNPSFLTASGDKLYVVTETSEAASDVVAYRLACSDPSSLSMEPVSRSKLADGTNVACHAAVSPDNRMLLVANYGAKSGVAAFPINPEDGSLPATAPAAIQHADLDFAKIGPNAGRQEAPHAHGSFFHANPVSFGDDGCRYHAFVCDLGTDRVVAYTVDHKPRDAVTLQTTEEQLHLGDGMGPRHMVFHENGKWAYVINELGSTITGFGVVASKEKVKLVPLLLPDGNVWSTLDGKMPADDTVTTCADIHVSKCGKFLYGSNRGHDSIAAFQIDEASGGLSLIGHCSTQGKTPRNFTLDPTGRLMLVANQDTDTIVAFAVDEATGQLTPTGEITDCPSPVCVQWVTLPVGGKL